MAAATLRFTIKSASAKSNSNLIIGTSTEEPGVTIHIELNWALLLPFEIIRNFLRDTAETTFEYELGTREHLEMHHKIDLAMMEVLWKSQEIPRQRHSYEVAMAVVVNKDAKLKSKRKRFIFAPPQQKAPRQ